MSDTKKMIKMQDLSGMQTALEALLKQAWERGYKYGLMEAEQKLQVKVLIGGEQVYPDKEYCEFIKKEQENPCERCVCVDTGINHCSECMYAYPSHFKEADNE